MASEPKPKPPPPKPKLDLDDDKRFALMKFRRSVADVMLPHHDDHFLLRWLRARSWNAEAAEKMLRTSMEWRKKWEVDGALKTWPTPEPVALYHPSGHCGYDKEGCPVIVIPFGNLDAVGMLHSVCKDDLIRSTIQILERYLDLAYEVGQTKVTAIFDMEDFNLKQYAWKPAAELVIQLIQMYEANYPEILKTCYIVNAPRVFAIGWNVVKRFLNEYTLGKILIFKSDPKKWKKAILQTIDPDNIPKHYGGELCDPDGNPRYTTKIKQGGKVPEKYYTKNLVACQAETETGIEMETATIKKGHKLTLDFIVAEEGSFLRWDFKTDGHDIKFGVTVKDEDGKTTVPIKCKRVHSHQQTETGVITCQAPATYTVVFDNTYSLFRSKKLHYNVHVAPPIEKLDILSEEVIEDGHLKDKPIDSTLEESSIDNFEEKENRVLNESAVINTKNVIAASC